MLQAESSSSLLCLWTARSLPAAPHPVSRRRSCLPLRTDQCFCPMGTFTPLLVRTLRRTSQDPSGRVPDVVALAAFPAFPAFPALAAFPTLPALAALAALPALPVL